MQVRAEQLTQHLGKGLSRCYLVSGEEPLIIQECADAIRAAARAGGCSEREVIDVSGSDSWQHLLQSAGAMSLFAERKLIELRLPTGKPGAEGSKALLEYLQFDSEDVLLIISGKIDRQSQRAKWFTALDQAGVVITAWPISARDLPRWLGQRLQQAGLKADREALQLLSERVEGNLLAAVQEIEKLKLLAEGDAVTVQTVMDSVLDNARYSTFGLADTAMEGDARSAIRTLRGLEAEATQPPVVLWALARDVQLLAQLDEDRRNGVALTQAMNQRGVWRNRSNLVQAAIARHNTDTIVAMQQLAYQADGAVKGFQRGNPWDFLDQLVMLMALGTRAHHPANKLRRRA